jgi:hypothetical protein
MAFLDETDPMSSAFATAAATPQMPSSATPFAFIVGLQRDCVRVREYPITLDKLLDRLPSGS